MNFRRDEPVYVWADEFKVEQVIRNYMSNAIPPSERREDCGSKDLYGGKQSESNSV